jgi:hypothetical protein
VQRLVLADLEVGDTAGLETCATKKFAVRADVILGSKARPCHLPQN